MTDEDTIDILDCGPGLSELLRKLEALLHIIRGMTDSGEINVLYADKPHLVMDLEKFEPVVDDLLEWHATEYTSDRKTSAWCPFCARMQKVPHFCEEEGDSTEWQCDDIDIDEFIAGLA